MTLRRLIVLSTTDRRGRVDWPARLWLYLRYWRALLWDQLR